MSLADACLVRLSAIHRAAEVNPLGADFKIYRRHGNKIVPVRMWSEPACDHWQRAVGFPAQEHACLWASESITATKASQTSSSVTGAVSAERMRTKASRSNFIQTLNSLSRCGM